MTIALSVANRPIEDHIDDIAAHGVIIRTSGFGAVTTGATTQGSDVLACTPPPGAVGHSVWIQYAGAGGAPLVATVLEIVPGGVRLSASASTPLASAEVCFFDANDQQALLDAIAELPPTGGKLIARHPILALSQAVTLGNGSASAPSTVQNIEIYGVAGSTGDALLNDVHGFQIRCVSASVLPSLFRAEGPVRVSLFSAAIDCAWMADTAFDGMHWLRGTMEDSGVFRARKVGVNLDAYPAPAETFVGCSGNHANQTFINMNGVNGAIGWKIGGDTFTQGLDVATCSLSNSSVVMSDDVSLATWQAAAGPNMNAAMQLGFADNVNIWGLFTYINGLRKGHGIRIKPPAGLNGGRYPCEVNVFGSPIIGGVGYDFSGNTWKPDENSGNGLAFWPLNFGDMTDPTGGKSPAPLPESKLLGGREGINGFTHTAILLDRHQTEHWRDGRISYGVSVQARRTSMARIQNSNVATDVFVAQVPAHMLRVFDRTPNANVYRNDRLLTFNAFGDLLNNTAAPLSVALKLYVGSVLVFNATVSVPQSLYWRSWRLCVHVGARHATVQVMDGTWRWGVPGSGGANAGAEDAPLTRVQGNTGLAINPAIDNTARVEATLGAADPSAIFDLTYAWMELT